MNQSVQIWDKAEQRFYFFTMEIFEDSGDGPLIYFDIFLKSKHLFLFV